MDFVLWCKREDYCLGAWFRLTSAARVCELSRERAYRQGIGFDTEICPKGMHPDTLREGFAQADAWMRAFAVACDVKAAQQAQQLSLF